jgi:hypothetical protein
LDHSEKDSKWSGKDFDRSKSLPDRYSIALDLSEKDIERSGKEFDRSK